MRKVLLNTKKTLNEMIKSTWQGIYEEQFKTEFEGIELKKVIKNKQVMSMKQNVCCAGCKICFENGAFVVPIERDDLERAAENGENSQKPARKWGNPENRYPNERIIVLDGRDPKKQRQSGDTLNSILKKAHEKFEKIKNFWVVYSPVVSEKTDTMFFTGKDGQKHTWTIWKDYSYTTGQWKEGGKTMKVGIFGWMEDSLENWVENHRSTLAKCCSNPIESLAYNCTCTSTDVIENQYNFYQEYKESKDLFLEALKSKYVEKSAVCNKPSLFGIIGLNADGKVCQYMRAKEGICGFGCGCGESGWLWRMFTCSPRNLIVGFAGAMWATALASIGGSFPTVVSWLNEWVRNDGGSTEFTLKSHVNLNAEMNSEHSKLATGLDTLKWIVPDHDWEEETATLSGVPAQDLSPDHQFIITEDMTDADILSTLSDIEDVAVENFEFEIEENDTAVTKVAHRVTGITDGTDGNLDDVRRALNGLNHDQYEEIDWDIRSYFEEPMENLGEHESTGEIVLFLCSLTVLFWVGLYCFCKKPIECNY